MNSHSEMFPLSIITVCRNEIKRIEFTCQSVVQQTFQHFEWIVIDGGSTDGTLDILKQYAHRMNYFVSEPDRGIYHAMNKGIAQAHGTYLLFLNGGDYLYESETLANIFTEADNLQHDVYYGDVVLEKNDGFRQCSFDFTNPYEMLAFRTIPHQAAFIKRTLFIKYGNYDESLAICADLDFFLRVFVSSQKGKGHTIAHVPFLISVYENIEGFSSTNIARCHAENKKVRRKHYAIWYLPYVSVKHWLMRQKQRGKDSIRYRCNKFRERKALCRKSA